MSRSRAALRRRIGAAFIAGAPLAAAAALVWPCTCPSHARHKQEAAPAMTHAGMPHAQQTAAPFGEEPSIALLAGTRRAAAPSATPPLTKELVEAANAKLSRRCQRLVKTKRVRALSRRDRARRSDCFAKRRKILRELAAQRPSDSTPTDCATPCYGAVGVRAVDNGIPFVLTRGTVTADIVVFELENADRQLHNLAIAPTDSLGNITGPATTLIPDTPPIDPALPVARPTAQAALKAGSYLLICTLPGHGPMAVAFKVKAPVRAA